MVILGPWDTHTWRQKAYETHKHGNTTHMRHTNTVIQNLYETQAYETHKHGNTTPMRHTQTAIQSLWDTQTHVKYTLYSLWTQLVNSMCTIQNKKHPFLDPSADPLGCPATRDQNLHHHGNHKHHQDAGRYLHVPSHSTPAVGVVAAVTAAQDDGQLQLLLLLLLLLL